MPYPFVSKYPNGFANGVEILGMPVLNGYANDVYWVCATEGSDGNKGTRDRPFATLQKAIDTAADDKGDVIFVKPNHRETTTTAVDVDKRGLTIAGLSVGGMKPQFLLDSSTTTDSFGVTVADVTISNLRFLSGTSDMAEAIDVDAARCSIVGCEFRDNTTHENFTTGIRSGSTTDNVCDGLTIVGNEFYTATDSHTAFAILVGDTDRLTVVGNKYVMGAPAGSAGIFLNGTAGDDWQQVTIADNYVSVTNTATDSYPLGGGNDQTDNTGLMVDNYVANRASVGTTGAASQNLFTKGTGFSWINCYHVGKGALPGKRMPIATDEAGWY